MSNPGTSTMPHAPRGASQQISKWMVTVALTNGVCEYSDGGINQSRYCQGLVVIGGPNASTYPRMAVAGDLVLASEGLQAPIKSVHIKNGKG